MYNYFTVAPVLSFVGAVGFAFVAFESGKLALLGMTVVMLCNGINFWTKTTENSADIKEQNVGEKNNE